MKTSELKKLLKQKGARFKSQGKKHAVWENPQTGQQARLPRHDAQEIANGTLQKILKQLGYK